jgi:hypothetical protein
VRLDARPPPERLASGEPAFAEAWAHEVRRFSPFATRRAGATRTPVHRHRCPGEQNTVALLSALAVRLARLDADVPDQDLTIPLHRIPTRPLNGVVLRVHGGR